MSPRLKSLSLVELLIALSLLSAIVLAVFGYHEFASREVRANERRALVHNQLSYSIEHISRHVLRAGTRRPPIVEEPNGFTMWIDGLNVLPTPDDTSDDWTVSYFLNGSSLICTLNNEILSSRILPGVEYGPIPAPDALPTPPSGMYWSLTGGNDAILDILLVGRFFPLQNVSMDNPQEIMRTTIYARNSPSE